MVKKIVLPADVNICMKRQIFWRLQQTRTAIVFFFRFKSKSLPYLHPLYVYLKYGYNDTLLLLYKIKVFRLEV